MSTTEDAVVTSPPSFPEPNFKSISVSGFSSQANNFADDFVVSKIFKKVLQTVNNKYVALKNSNVAASFLCDIWLGFYRVNKVDNW